MQCLWITHAYPDPAINGQLIYSKGLIEAVHGAGASLCVIGLARPGESTPCGDAPGLTWRLTERRRRSRAERLIGGLPDFVQGGGAPASVRAVQRALAERGWDGVVIDSICAAWALDTIMQHRAGAQRPPRLVYLAHNHESTVARRIADASHGLRRLTKEIDAFKVGRLERRLVAASDLVTSNTPEDARTFAAAANGTPVAFLPPGYSGPRVAARTIAPDTPRRIVMVGSFDWPPKRVSLERCLEVALPKLAGAGIEVQVVGSVEPGYLADMRRRYPQAMFVGPVEDVRPYMAGARLAVVPDTLGGFKLKGLDYAFSRLPILALRGALPGMPLVDGKSIGLFDSHGAQADAAIELIDDFVELNRRQMLAFEACAARFDWSRIGHHLLGWLQRLERLGPKRAPQREVRSQRAFEAAAR